MIEVEEPAGDEGVRWIPLNGATNAREVAGFRTFDGKTVQPRRLLRSDTLAGLPPSDGRLLVEQYGLTTIVDLRDDDECELEEPTPVALRRTVAVHRAPLLIRPPTRRGDAVPRGDLLKPRSDEAGGSPYWRYLIERPDSVVRALRLIAAANGAALVNCAAGKDRTGLLTAIALAEVGVEEDSIVSDYMASASRIEPLLARLAASRTYGSSLAHRSVVSYTPKPRFLLDVLAGLRDLHGGVQDWLATHGWNCDDHDALCSKLLVAGSSVQTPGG